MFISTIAKSRPVGILTQSSFITFSRPMQGNPDSGFRIPGNFCLWNPASGIYFYLWNPQSWDLKSGIQPKESGIQLMIGIQNPSSTDKDYNPVPGMRNSRRGTQNSRPSWIHFRGARFFYSSVVAREERRAGKNFEKGSETNLFFKSVA